MPFTPPWGVLSTLPQQQYGLDEYGRLRDLMQQSDGALPYGFIAPPPAQQPVNYPGDVHWGPQGPPPVNPPQQVAPGWAASNPENFFSKLVRMPETFVRNAWEGIVSGLTLPHDAMTGEVQPGSPEMIQRSLDTAGMMGGAPPGALGAGPIRLPGARAPDAPGPAPSLLVNQGFQSRTIGPTSVDYSVHGDAIDIHKLYTPPEDRGGGAARAAMEQMAHEADEAGATLRLTPEGMEPGISDSRLANFYRSLGFLPNKGKNKDFTTQAAMVRTPSSPMPPGPPLRQQAAPTETPEFQSWFGDSQVRDEQGAPLIVYKGMMDPADDAGNPRSVIQRQSLFPTFDRNDPEGTSIAGFFSSDPEVANRFASHSKEVGGGVFPVYLNISRPFEIDAQGEFAGNIEFGPSGAPFREAIRSGNYDGVIIRNTKDEGDVFVPLRPEQIKSVNNQGTFDPNDPNILRAQGLPAPILPPPPPMTPQQYDDLVRRGLINPNSI